MRKYLNQGISTPIAITIIIVLAIIMVGGVFAYQYWWMPKEEAKLTPTPTPSLEETARELLSDYLNSYKSTDVSLKERLKSYLINEINIDITESECFGFTAVFSVETFKDLNNGWTDWVAGNGAVSGNWVNNKTINFDAVKEGIDYKLKVIGTGRASSSCSESSKDETSDWKTYKNEDYGFEIKYPKDWTSESSNPDYALLEVLFQEGEKNLITLRVQDRETFRLGTRDWEDFKVGQIDGSISYTMKANKLVLCEILFFRPTDNYLFYISTEENVITNKTINQILSTFKFLK